MQNADVSVESRPLGISGRLINPPEVVYGNQQTLVRPIRRLAVRYERASDSSYL